MLKYFFWILTETKQLSVANIGNFPKKKAQVEILAWIKRGAKPPVGDATFYSKLVVIVILRSINLVMIGLNHFACLFRYVGAFSTIQVHKLKPVL